VVLVDTSVWVEVFRKPSRIQLESLVDFDDIVTCLPVVQEVLQGFDAEPAFVRARESMLALPIVESPLGQDVLLEAVALYRSGRRGGVTIRSSIGHLRATGLALDREISQGWRADPRALLR
jgi:predicted nucleic acid-binding protein